MTLKTYFRLLGLTIALLLFPALASAQNSVKCESNDGGRNYCGNYNSDDVRFDRQISGSPCVQGKSWGVDRRGLWVDRGCRAYFVIRVGRPGGPGGPGGPGSGPGGPGGGWWNPAPGDPWPPRGNWHGGRWDQGGACFYTNRNFGGRFFCLRRGDALASLASYGNDISSIRVFGGTRVDIFNSNNFSGPRDSIRGDVPDLRGLSVSQMPNHTWNNRISSLRVR
ncbi:MAG TPA: DUF3011 domain-containing protein [Candidatus Aquilonibacter sp.]|nr:DUF3011 domain-containing protein [Candidatus Aquilonibacter sp.]